MLTGLRHCDIQKMRWKEIQIDGEQARLNFTQQKTKFRMQHNFIKYSIIDINFDFRTESKGQDIDSASPTLRQYHKILWSKILPNGKMFELSDKKDGIYLYHQSELGEFFLGSDAITHSYKNHKRKQWLIRQIPNEVDELYAMGCTIGAYIIFPTNKIKEKNTVNQERGCNS